MRVYDVIVIGSGIGGLMASRVLSKRNVDFLCIEGKKEVGLPLRCGEGVREEEFVSFFKRTDYPFVKNW